MRTLPAAWQAAADAGAVVRSHSQRLLMRIEISPAPTYLWLSLVDPARDRDGLGMWTDAWDGPEHNGPFPLLRQIPALSGHSDLETLTSMSAYIGNLVLANVRHEPLFNALGAWRLSELEAAGWPLAELPVEVYLIYAGTAWADRITWKLRTMQVNGSSLEELSVDLSDQIGEGNTLVNAAVNGNPLPIVIGGGSAPATELLDVVTFSDRLGKAVPLSLIRPTNGAPWTVGHRVTIGSSSQPIASITGGVTNDDTILNFASPITRFALLDEGSLTTNEQGYTVPDRPLSSSMDYAWADPTFAPGLGRIMHLPIGGVDLVGLAPTNYAFLTDGALPIVTPVATAPGRFSLGTRPRFQGQYGQVWINGDDTADVLASVVFATLCAGPFALDASRYSIDVGAGTTPLGGRIRSGDGWNSSLEFLRSLEINTCSRIFWTGEALRMRKRRTSAEIIAAGPDAVVRVSQMPQGFPGTTGLPLDFREHGFIGRWNLTPGRPWNDPTGYRGSQLYGSNRTATPERWWLDLVRDDAAAMAVLSAWYELLGEMSDGTWPKYIPGLVLGPEFMKYEPEDVFELVVEDGNGNAFEGMDGSGTRLWRVMSKATSFPQRRGELGTLTFALLEVHR